MTRAVAFLRGINVGGHVAKKEKIREVFSWLGFSNVISYKQSGNVVFETESADMEMVRAKIEAGLRKALGFDVPVFIRTISQLKAIVEGNSKEVSEGSSLLVTLLPIPVGEHALPLPSIIPKSTAEVYSSSGLEFFSLTHGGGKGALPNPFLESKLKVKATTRNMNVLREIVERFG